MSYQDLDNKILHYSDCSNLSEHELWIITLGSILSAYNGDYINAIDTRYELNSIKEGLQAMWGINNRQTFEQTAFWLIHDGNRHQYQIRLQHLKPYLSFNNKNNTLVKCICTLLPRFSVIWYQVRNKIDLRIALKELGFDKITDEEEKNGAFVNMFTDALNWSKLLSERGLGDTQSVNNLLAWDAVRLANIARWSLLLGYINHDHFIQNSNTLKAQLQTTYHSWQEVALAYAIGALIWNGDEERAEAITKPLQLMIEDQQSPFYTVLFK